MPNLFLREISDGLRVSRISYFIPITNCSEVGDQVNEDELIAEIETDKTSVEVNAPQSGTIVEFLVEDGSKVTAKQKLYKLQKGAGGGAAVSFSILKKIAIYFTGCPS